MEFVAVIGGQRSLEDLLESIAGWIPVISFVFRSWPRASTDVSRQMRALSSIA